MRDLDPGTAKYGDHLPLYRQEMIFARAGLAIPRSTLAQWVNARNALTKPPTAAQSATYQRAYQAADRAHNRSTTTSLLR